MDKDIMVDREDFHMQRAYLYALTMREDVPVKVKALIQTIEEKLAQIGGVKSVFEEQPNSEG